MTANSQNSDENRRFQRNIPNTEHSPIKETKEHGILLPINFSDKDEDKELCKKTLGFAFALSERVHQEISLLHIYDDIHLSERRLGKEKVKEKLAEHEQKLRRDIRSFINRYISQKQSRMLREGILKRGNQVNETIALLKKHAFTWMIVGMKQNKRFKDYLFGNNLEEIINSTNTSTIAVPEDVTFNGINKIVYVTNFIDDNVLALQELDEFACLFGAHITILHIDSHATTNEKKVVKRYRRAIARMLTAPFEVVVVASKQIADSIDKYVQEQQTDLLAILKKDRSFAEKMFHSSLTERLLSTTKIPMLILREESVKA